MIIAAFILIAAGVLIFIFTPLFDPRDANTINQISRRGSATPRTDRTARHGL